MCRRFDAGGSGSQWRGADDILSGGAGDGARFSFGDSSRSSAGSGTLLPLGSFQPGARWVPSFSINEGIKYAGHSAEWGIEQAKDFTEHRYHQPSDEYSPDRDFTGDASDCQIRLRAGLEGAWLPTWRAGFPAMNLSRRARRAKRAARLATIYSMASLRFIWWHGTLAVSSAARQTRILV